MQPDPWETPQAEAPERGTLAWPWRFVVAGAVFLVLALVVPDEPLHLSGVMVVLGLASGALALLSGIGSAVRSEPSERGSALGAATCGFVLLVAWLAWWFMELMSQLS